MNEVVPQQNVIKHIFFFFSIGFCSFVCISMIYFVIDAYIIHPLSYPISVVVSNINKTTATVNFVSYQQQKTCVFLYNISKFSAQVFCEKDGSKFHAIDVVGLQANTVYHIIA